MENATLIREEELSSCIVACMPELSSDAMQNIIDNPGTLKKVLKKALLCFKKEQKFDIWKTITLGTRKNKNQFVYALKKKGCAVSNGALSILSAPDCTILNKRTDIDLVKVTVTELGFPDGANGEDIYNRALKLGLKLCPSEVGLQLRLQYSDQPKDEWLNIAMEPIFIHNVGLHIFSVINDKINELKLWDHYGNPDQYWDGNYNFVFVHQQFLNL